MLASIFILMAFGLVLGACTDQPNEELLTPHATLLRSVAETPQLPFHSEVQWDFVQHPLPEGRCTADLPDLPDLPAPLSYLWYTELSGTAISTHLGRGPFEGGICIYGQLTDPGAAPPDNGIPFGWMDGRMVLTAANGDRLLAEFWSTGFTAPPGTPGWAFTEEGNFVDGGTGRFLHAEGDLFGVVDAVAQTAVYDGWIRFGKGK